MDQYGLVARGRRPATLPELARASGPRLDATARLLEQPSNTPMAECGLDPDDATVKRRVAVLTSLPTAG